MKVFYKQQRALRAIKLFFLLQCCPLEFNLIKIDLKCQLAISWKLNSLRYLSSRNSRLPSTLASIAMAQSECRPKAEIIESLAFASLVMKITPLDWLWCCGCFQQSSALSGEVNCVAHSRYQSLCLGGGSARHLMWQIKTEINRVGAITVDGLVEGIMFASKSENG